VTRESVSAIAVTVLTLALPGPGTGKPAKKPPTPPTRPAPPPAWIQTRGGDHWLAYGAYCWPSSGRRAACFDPLPPEARTDIPRIVLRPGEIVRFHLGFRPRELGLSIGKRIIPLARSATPRWRVSGPGGTALLHAKLASAAGYQARFSVRRPGG
jgi:hypothetical protein